MTEVNASYPPRNEKHQPETPETEPAAWKWTHPDLAAKVYFWPPSAKHTEAGWTASPLFEAPGALLAVLKKTVDQLSRVKDDTFRQAGGYALQNAIGKEFSCYEISRCGEVAAEARKVLAMLEAAPSLRLPQGCAPEPYAAATTDHTGCVHIGVVKGIEAIAAAGAKGPTEVVYLYASVATTPQTLMQGYQERVAAAHHALFHDDPTDIEERRNRFAEEVNETLQAFGMTEDEAIALVRYTWSRPVGQPEKEVGAALLTLASLCVVAGIDMAACGEADLEKLQRPETIARIRAKRATRHGRGPLPGFDPSLATEGKA